MSARRATTVSVIIPTMRQRFLRHCLQGLCKQTVADFEVIVVENGERSNATTMAVSEHDRALDIQYHYVPVAGGNRARNQGAKLARGELIAFLDDDCVPAPHWIATIIDNPDLRQRPAVIGGKVILQFPTPPPGWFTGVFTRSLSAVDLGPERRSLFDWEYVVSANLAVSKRVFVAIGGFDPEIGINGKDDVQLGNDEIEFLHRFTGNEGSLIYDPAMLVTHLIPAERVSLHRVALRRYGQGVSDVALALRTQHDPMIGPARQIFIQQLCNEKSGSDWIRDMTSQRNELDPENAAVYDRSSRIVRLSYLCGLLRGLENLGLDPQARPQNVSSQKDFADGDTENNGFWLDYLQSMDILKKDRWITDWVRSEIAVALTGGRLANA